MHNLIAFLNNGTKSTFEKMTLALLSTQVIRDDEGKTIAYRAEILPLTDKNKYVKRNGEVVNGPNALHTFNITVNSQNLPENHGMIEGIKLMNPRFVSAFATSQTNSTFATIRTTMVCDNIIFPDKSKERGEH